MASSARMDKVAFRKALEGRGLEELRTLLWTAYWRGTAAARERIEELLDPREAAKKREASDWVDPEDCFEEVLAFCARARAGDYMRGARDLGRKEVSGWRLTFRRLFDDSARVLQQPDTAGDVRSLVHLLEFTHDLKDWEYFRTQGRRANRLAHWHGLLLERLMESEDASLLERILAHPTLNGPETWHLLARLRLQQGKRTEAQALVQKALKRLPGSRAIQATALELDVAGG